MTTQGKAGVLDFEAEAVRRSAYLRNICADLSRRADPSHRTDDEMEVLGKVMDNLDALERHQVTSPAYAVNRANILEQVAIVASNAINANNDIGEGIKPVELGAWAGGGLSARFETSPNDNGAKVGGAPKKGAAPAADEVVTGKADELVRRALRSAWAVLFDASSGDEADSLQRAVASGIYSIFWFQRSVASEGGRHPAPLDDDDLSWRSAVNDELFKRLRQNGDPLQRSIATRLIAAMVYATGELGRQDAETVIEIAYSSDALAQFNDWRTFRYTLESLNNIIVALIDPNREGGDGREVAIEAQARLVKRGAELLQRMLERETAPEERVRHAGAALANAVTVYADRFDDPALAPALRQSWLNAAAVLSPYLERFRIEHELLLFLAIPNMHGFEDATSELAGMDFSDVPRRLQPILDAGRVAGYDLRNHYRKYLDLHFYNYAMSCAASEADILHFIEGMERHVGEAYRQEAFGSLATKDVFDLSLERALTLLAWTGADGGGSFDANEGTFAEAVYSLWTRLLFDGHTAMVANAVERFWNQSQDAGVIQRIRTRTLALRGFALLVSYCGAEVDAGIRFEERLRALRRRQPLDYRARVSMPAAEERNWRDHDDAVVEATLALATIDISNGGDVNRWTAEEGWSMNFSSVRELDRRLAGALHKRITDSGDPASAIADLERIRRLALRNPGLMLPALKAVLDVLPDDHPQRAALAAEHDAEQRKAPASNVRVDAPAPYAEDADTLTAEQETRIRERSSAATGWPLAPPYPSDWADVDADGLVAAVRRTLTALPLQHASARNDLSDAMRARRTDLPFYKDHTLFEILIDDGVTPRSISMVFGPNAGTWLTGASPAIHALNEAVPIDLAKGIHVESYLRFFTTYVQGEEGPFTVVTSREELMAHLQSGMAFSDSEEEIVAARLQKAREFNRRTASGMPTDSVIETDAEGRYRFMALVIYARHVFESNFAIVPAGMIEMLEDDPLFESEKMQLERIIEGWRLGAPDQQSGTS